MTENTVDRIKELAEQKRTSLQDLASDLGFGVNSIYKWGTNTPRVDKVKLDDFLEEKIDKEGRVAQYNGQARYLHVLDQTAKNHIAKYQQGVSEDVLKRIKEDINTETRNKVVDSIMKDYSLKKLIGSLE